MLGMRERTLRRKLQKKLKHKPYRKCPKCGGRMDCVIRDCRLFKYCGWMYSDGHVERGPHGCGHFEELFWSGGGKADTYPRSRKAEVRERLTWYDAARFSIQIAVQVRLLP